jgi:hypothetical protein
MGLKREKNNFTHVRVPIECAQCGEQLYMPEWSECLADDRVRHLWRCEVCDYSFETTIRVTEKVAENVESECT